MELVPKEENVCYLTGMTIEGAIWDIETKCLVDMKTHRFNSFPGLRVDTVRMPEYFDTSEYTDG